MFIAGKGKHTKCVRRTPGGFNKWTDTAAVRGTVAVADDIDKRGLNDKDVKKIRETIPAN